MRERRKPKKDTAANAALAALREAFKPVFDAQREEEARECPTRLERLRELHVNISSFGGNCPVQIEGHVKGKPFYFRARGEHWSLGIGGEPVAKPDWYKEEEYGIWPEAGWMPLHVAYDFLIASIEEWRGLPPKGAE